jgi:DNA replication protein DnaC
MRSIESLESLLKSLCLPCFVDHYLAVAVQSEKEKIDHVGYLNTLATLEYDRRCQQRIERLTKQAKLPRNKRLTEFEVTRIPGLSPSLIHQLGEGEFIDRCENILIFGNPGSGKTHLSIALAHEWCLKGRRVLYTVSANLIAELLRAKHAGMLDLFIKKLDRFEVLIIDDISYIPCDRNETDVLFMLLAARYEQRSLVVSSNLVFSMWHQIFKDEMTTAAAIDRLVHHAVVLELNAPSFRMNQAKKQKEKKSNDHHE